MLSRPSREVPRLNYFDLNDGSDEEGRSQKRSKWSFGDTPDFPLNQNQQTGQPPDSIEPGDSVSNINTQLTMQEKDGSQVSSSVSRSKSSFVWQYFEEIEMETSFIEKNGRTMKDIFFRCTLCPVKQRPDYKKSNLKGSTGDLSRHLRDKHSILKDGQGVVKDNITQYLKEGSVSTRESMRDKLLRWIGKTAQPYNVVETMEFQELFSASHQEPLPIKTGNGVKAALKNKYGELVTKRLAKFGESKGKIALSLDCWTSVTGDSFMAIVGHALSEDFEYSEMLLNFSQLMGPHTGDLLFEMVMKCITDYNLHGRIISITGDNASNNDAMVDKV